MDASVTSSGTHIAPFVNAEESEYLVIEDDFPNGRPALEKAGFLFTNRDTVNKVERMKVCTCLNPLHTALAIYGCLLGYQKISEEMKDPELLELVRRIGYQEGLPVVEDPVVMEPKAFLDTVLNVRLPNPFMPDTPQRIATDTSQKLAIRFGETIKAYLASDTLDVRNLKLIPLVFAGWLRYLMAVDDTGAAFTPSPDPMMESAAASDRKAGPENAESYMGKLAALLYERFKAGALPVAMVSMDNCSHNGDKLRTAVSAFARAWAENGLVEREFVDYIESGVKVSFPWTAPLSRFRRRHADYRLPLPPQPAGDLRGPAF